MASVLRLPDCKSANKPDDATPPYAISKPITTITTTDTHRLDFIHNAFDGGHHHFVLQLKFGQELRDNKGNTASATI
jgi:hypothetical protein